MMTLEVLLFYVEVIYLWRALPFCSTDVKQQLLAKLSAPLPSGAQPVHQAMRAWLRGGLFNSLEQPIEAEKVSGNELVLWRSRYARIHGACYVSAVSSRGFAF